MEGEHPSTDDVAQEESREEEEWDAEGGFSKEVRNQNYLGELLVFGYDSDEIE